MPNHTINTVTMKNISKKKLFSYGGEGKYFDFNKLVPEPKTKEECPARYIDDGSRHLTHDEGREWFNWYDWNCDFWGTKWNSYCLSENGPDEITFWTAWSEPNGIWKALSKRYPKEKIYIRASYEEGIETESVWLNGKRIHFNEWEADYEGDY